MTCCLFSIELVWSGLVFTFESIKAIECRSCLIRPIFQASLPSFEKGKRREEEGKKQIFLFAFAVLEVLRYPKDNKKGNNVSILRIN